MWLTSSSIGRKFVMALTGICLVLFVTFHVLMNAVALLWPTAYNSICEFLGANWYALVASAGLALLFIIHIIYACWLTIQNRAARGTDRYAVTSRPPQVEWASKNMLILGVVILAFLVVHLIQFWAKMQLVEVCHTGLDKMPQLNEVPVPPTMGTLMLQLAFSEWWTPVVYIIGFIALWFHMNHGFWSMLHSVGWDNNKWLPRLKAIGCWWTSIVVLLFIAQAVTFTVLSNKNYYTENLELQNQYAGYWNEYCAEVAQEYIDGQTKVLAPYMKTYNDATEAINKAYETNKSADEIGKLQETCDKAREEMRTAATQYTQQNGPALITKAEYVQKMFEKQFHKAAIFQAQPMASQIEGFQLLLGIYQQVKQQIDKPQIQPNY